MATDALRDLQRGAGGVPYDWVQRGVDENHTGQDFDGDGKAGSGLHHRQWRWIMVEWAYDVVSLFPSRIGSSISIWGAIRER